MTYHNDKWRKKSTREHVISLLKSMPAETLLPYHVGSFENNSPSLFRRWYRMPRFQRCFIVFAILIVASILLLGWRFNIIYLPSQDIPDRHVDISLFESFTSIDDVNPTGYKPDVDVNIADNNGERRKAVIKAIRHAWKPYAAHAWGYDEVKPISQAPHTWFDLALTMVDSLDTLWLAGLREEFESAREYIATRFTVRPDRDVNLFEVTIRVLGGLLSAFHLSGDAVFLEKAELLGERLFPAFVLSKSPIPFSDVNLKRGTAHGPQWNADSSVSEVSTLQLEFKDLAIASGDPKFCEFADKTSLHLHTLSGKVQSLVPMFANPNSGQFRRGTTITLGARSDTYYEYLLKQWIQTGKTVDWLRDDYLQTIEDIRSKLVAYSKPGNLLYIGELLSGTSFSPKMDHLVCFLPGTLVLGVMNGLPRWHAEIAEKLLHTCYQMYIRMPTRLSPEIAYFSQQVDAVEDIIVKPLDSHNLLRPETVESIFYMWRYTNNTMYRDWGWTIFQAFERFTRHPPGGYTALGNVRDRSNVKRKDKMDSFFIAETLKYLLLLFSDNSVLPLDKYVFNTEAHPLPIHTKDKFPLPKS